MVRVHTFLEHDDVNFVDARRIKLSLSDVENISRSIKKNPKDTPDAILRMEEDAIKKGYYSPFLSQYISEEFLVDKELSFIIVSILQYKLVNLKTRRLSYYIRTIKIYFCLVLLDV